MKLIECVPNFSEGRDRGVIDAITAEIEAVEGAMLLDVDPGAATNRTVVTFIGPPEAVEEAAFRAISKAAQLIDMSKHSGAHARMGATDVCPLVPVQGATMEDCIEVAKRLGERVGEELDIPVFLYEHAATKPERRSLAEIRKGEYEALPQKLQDPDFAPDFGPAAFKPRHGATVIGAREFLIAYNININSRDKKIAKKIAMELREMGKLKRGADGKPVRDDKGKLVWVPGRFKELRGIGWYIEEFGRAQLSFNFTNYKVTSVHDVFDAACEVAPQFGARVTGSELVGLIPMDAMLAAGTHYLTKQGQTTGVPVEEKLHAANLSLGLSELYPFEAGEKIIELKYQGAPEGLKAMTLHGFADELSSDSPAPGGGSVAALCGALSAALSAMVASLTWSKKGMQDARPQMKEIGDSAQELKAWFVDAIDRDTDAFNDVLAAMRLPKKTDEEIAAREAAMESANQLAAEVPLQVLRNAVACMEPARIAAAHGNPASVTDAGVAGACALAAAEGAALNVRINLGSIGDASVATAMKDETEKLIAEARAQAEVIRQVVEQKL
ncbi:formimidoyltransferase-cyclodeaminase [Acidobacteria bacterium Mor1]|nr:formimidoyltransferase-cyclodeaminase [Acidobacteria bacterium Mor1]